MITIYGISALGFIFLVHWIADFILQSHNIAQKKSTCLKSLVLHCVIYAIPFLFLGWKIMVWLFLTHFVIDFMTSKLNKYLWEAKKIHYFFISIGFDQWLHIMCILIGLKYFL